MASGSCPDPDFSDRKRLAGAAGRTRPWPSARLAGGAAGTGLAALGVLAALTDLRGDLGRQLVVAVVFAGMLEALGLPDVSWGCCGC
jgi:hypothetical protein